MFRGGLHALSRGIVNQVLQGAHTRPHSNGASNALGFPPERPVDLQEGSGFFFLSVGSLPPLALEEDCVET